jgi:1,4-dihydroxy-6-naphthoate synthase
MLIRKSVEYAFSHREETMGYIKAHSQELADEVIEQHINLYVNTYTRDLGSEGTEAVQELLQRAREGGVFKKSLGMGSFHPDKKALSKP